MKARSGIFIAITISLLGVSTPTAYADFFHDRATFTTAAPSLTSQDFDSLVGTAEFPQNYPAGEGTRTVDPTGLTVDGVNYLGYSAFGDETYILAPSVDSGRYSLNGTFALVGGRWTTTITLAPGTTAFGADFGLSGAAVGTLTFTIILATGETKTATLNTASRSQFFGIVEAAGITSIHAASSILTQFAPYTLIDNVAITPPATSPVPEPSSLLLALTAAVGSLIAAGRRATA